MRRRGCFATSSIARSTAGAVPAASSARPSTRRRAPILASSSPRLGAGVSYDARALYQDLYCPRGEAENRIGEQFELFANRASSATMQANQLHLWFSAMAYVLVDTLRRVGLRHTEFADAGVATIRLKLLKLGAQVRTSVRRIQFAIASLAHLYMQRAFSSA